LNACRITQWYNQTGNKTDMKRLTWINITCLLLLTNTAFDVYAENTELLINSANRYFSPLPDTMPGAENDTAERIALGKKTLF
jgi:hypothetical protein